MLLMQRVQEVNQAEEKKMDEFVERFNKLQLKSKVEHFNEDEIEGKFFEEMHQQNDEEFQRLGEKVQVINNEVEKEMKKRIEKLLEKINGIKEIINDPSKAVIKTRSVFLEESNIFDDDLAPERRGTLG